MQMHLSKMQESDKEINFLVKCKARKQLNILALWSIKWCKIKLLEITVITEKLEENGSCGGTINLAEAA